MASSSCSSMKKALIFGLFVVVLLINSSEAKDYVVGGHDDSWKIPSSPDAFDNWSNQMRLLVGDAIVFKYDPKVDSVIQTDEEDYKNCNKSRPLKTFNDGNSRFQFDKPGPYFFISGADGHCEQGEKVKLTVIHMSPAPASPPASPPAQAPSTTPVFHAPAPAPSGAGSSLKGGVLSLAVVVGGIVGAALV